jgi:hypothetical protein
MSDLIAIRRLGIEKLRRDAQREAMRVYDTETYYPALKALREECAALPGGHTEGHHHNNGLGWVWWYCGRCGAKHSEEHLCGEEEGDAPTAE